MLEKYVSSSIYDHFEDKKSKCTLCHTAKCNVVADNLSKHIYSTITDVIHWLGEPMTLTKYILQPPL